MASPSKRIVLVAGATGKQGRATARHLLRLPQPSASEEWTVWALTRNAGSTAALSLLREAENTGGGAGSRIELVEGDLDDPDSIRAIFDRGGVGIYGVFAVFAFQGLGAKPDKERSQAKLLADLSLEFRVPAFVYSSTVPTSSNTDDTTEPGHKVKREIEDYCQTELGPRGLNWTFLRPGIFMENFEGGLGPITTSIFHHGLKKDTTILPIASDDIGKLAAGIFANHAQYLHKTLVATSGAATMQEVVDGYRRATGKAMPAVPAFAAAVLLYLNAGVRNIIQQVERNHEARASGELATFEAEVALARSVCEVQDFEQWTRGKAEAAAAVTKGLAADAGDGNRNWNNVSLFKVLTGRA
ncbi:hypothetical protein B0T24DRAFT_548340 [Lasiosphaeria ovina]|uniref:NmrA-like domain-containing protein n=1 Tax=Lasiosphaeria ovina TaxID=92902 RepID=A0AAE0NFG9_9PEZI|nr:hypothetical protein B0T24DRAFT_548340 [Lasiosphaeria ovina]